MQRKSWFRTMRMKEEPDRLMNIQRMESDKTATAIERTALVASLVYMVL